MPFHSIVPYPMENGLLFKGDGSWMDYAIEVFHEIDNDPSFLGGDFLVYPMSYFREFWQAKGLEIPNYTVGYYPNDDWQVIVNGCHSQIS